MAGSAASEAVRQESRTGMDEISPVATGLRVGRDGVDDSSSKVAVGASLLGMKSAWVLAVVLGAVRLCAAQANVQELETALKGRQLFLRNFSAEKTPGYLWKDDHLVSTDGQRGVAVHALSVFVAKKATITGDGVEISGTRQIAQFDDASKAVLVARTTRPMTLRVKVEGVRPESVLARLPDALFFGDGREAIAEVPLAWRPFVPAPLMKDLKGELASKVIVELPGAWKSVPVQDVDLIGPNGKRKFDSASDIYRLQNASATGAFALLKDQKGALSDIWILIPLPEFGGEDFYVETLKLQSLKKDGLNVAYYGSDPVRCIFPILVRSEQGVQSFTLGR